MNNYTKMFNDVILLGDQIKFFSDILYKVKKDKLKQIQTYNNEIISLDISSINSSLYTDIEKIELVNCDTFNAENIFIAVSMSEGCTNIYDSNFRRLVFDTSSEINKLGETFNSLEYNIFNFNTTDESSVFLYSTSYDIPDGMTINGVLFFNLLFSYLKSIIDYQFCFNFELTTFSNIYTLLLGENMVPIDEYI